MYVDGIDKLPAEFEEKAIEYGLFDPEICAHSVAKLENHKHVKKSFTKTGTFIVSPESVSF